MTWPGSLGKSADRPCAMALPALLSTPPVASSAQVPRAISPICAPPTARAGAVGAPHSGRGAPALSHSCAPRGLDALARSMALATCSGYLYQRKRNGLSKAYAPQARTEVSPPRRRGYRARDSPFDHFGIGPSPPGSRLMGGWKCGGRVSARTTLVYELSRGGYGWPRDRCGPSISNDCQKTTYESDVVESMVELAPPTHAGCAPVQ